MIKCLRLDGNDLYINPDLIKFVESTPDTKITFENNHMILVREPVAVVINRIQEYRVNLGAQIDLATKNLESGIRNKGGDQ